MKFANEDISSRVVILGGTGFIGTALTEKIRATGMQVNTYGRDAFADQ